MNPSTHILVIRLSALGDVAMTIPVLSVVAQTYPELQITVVSRVFFKPLFEGIPNLHFLEADVYGKHKGLGLLKLAKKAKKLRIDAVADLHNVLRSKVISNYLKAVGIKTATINKGRAEKKLLVHAEGKQITPLKTMHQRYADVFENLGYPINLGTYSPPKLKKLSPRLQTLKGDISKKCIGIAPFAAYKSKMYPLELMKEVMTQLDAIKEYKIFLFGGGKEEIELLKGMEVQFQSVTNVAGALPFHEELELISNLDVMLSMDSGNGHLAAIYGIPVVTLWGVTHPYAGFTPFNQPESNQLLSDRNQYPLIPTSIYGNKYPESYENVMESIVPKTIVSTTLRVI